MNDNVRSDNISDSTHELAQRAVAQTRAWSADLLKLPAEHIASHLTFFELGADAAALKELSHRVEAEYGVEMGDKDLEDICSIEDMGRAIARHVASEGRGALLANAAPLQMAAPAMADAAATLLARFKEKASGPRYLNSVQRRGLNALIDRYTTKTQTSKQMTRDERPVMASFRNVVTFDPTFKEMVYPVIGDRAEGAYLWDVDGNRYLDATMGLGVLLFGHNAPFIQAAIEAELKKGIAMGPQARLAGDVTRLVCELTGTERATFVTSGTEAMMTALRLARAARNRDRVVLFSQSYHGFYDGTLCYSMPGERQVFPAVPGITSSVVNDVLMLEFADPEGLAIIRDHAHELAGVVVEPVRSRFPDVQPGEFLHQLRKLTAEHDIPLIFDDVMMGFRIAAGGTQAHFGIQADLAAYGKIMGGGLPIGVVAGKAKYLDCVDGGSWNYGDDSYPETPMTFVAGTFNRHPLVMASAKAALTEIKRRGPALYDEINARTARMAQTLNAFAEQEGYPLRVAHFGSVFCFNLTQFPKTRSLLLFHLLDRGIYIWEGGVCFLSTVHSDADLETIIEAVKDSVRELRATGFLPART